MTVLTHINMPRIAPIFIFRCVIASVMESWTWPWLRLHTIYCAMAGSVRSSDLSDEQLMVRYVEGDDNAFRELFERYAPRLYRAAKTRGLTPSESQDSVQQTFVHVHQGRKEFNTGEKVAPWIYTIGFNVIRDYGRRASAQWRMKKALRAEPLPSREAVPDAAESHDTDDLSEAVIQHALAHLSKDQREVIWLHYYEALSFVDIARVQGCKPGAIRAKAHRGYQKLRAVLPGLQRGEVTP